MNAREAVWEAKKQLEVAERKLADARVLRDRLERRLLTASEQMRPSLENALSLLTAETPRLQSEFDQSFDCLRSLTFVAGLDMNRIHTRSVDFVRGPRRYSGKHRGAPAR